MTELEITTLIKQLSRAHPSGGVVIERAAILAAGADYPAIMAWIIAHAGAPEATSPQRRSRGLHGPRFNDTASDARHPTRFVLPAGALA